MSAALETRILQAIIAIAALLPVSAGLAGVVIGPAFLDVEPDAISADLDSHLRFLSGVFLAVGLAWWSCVPGIARKTERFRLLAAFTIAGGIARAYSLTEMPVPSLGHQIGLGMELVVVPLLVIWQARIAARH